MSEFKCNICNLEFKTKSGMWKHNNNKHIVIKEEKYQCKYCNKELSDRHSRWKHETKVCKMNTTNKQVINNITNITNITNNITNITNITNNITFNEIGKEDISILTQDEIEEIINKGLDSVVKLIEYINFNKNRPENHTICTTNLNNKYVSTLNIDTYKIEKQLKTNIFDKMLMCGLTHIDMMLDNITSKRKKKIFTEKIRDLENKIYSDINYRKIFQEDMNILSYNKRDIVNNTWDIYINNLV